MDGLIRLLRLRNKFWQCLSIAEISYKKCKKNFFFTFFFQVALYQLFVLYLLLYCLGHFYACTCILNNFVLSDLRFMQMKLFPPHLHDILVRNKCSIHTYIHTSHYRNSMASLAPFYGTNSGHAICRDIDS